MAGRSMRRNVEPSHCARHKYTGHLNVHTTVRPKLCKFNRARLKNVFNWPATFAVYAAIPCKVKTKSRNAPMLLMALTADLAVQQTRLLDPNTEAEVPALNARGARRCPQLLARGFATTF